MNRYRFLFVGAVIALAMCANPVSLQAAVTIVSGNGQLTNPPALTSQYVPVFQQMVVRVTDANGVPQPNVAVSWAITLGGFNSYLLFGAATTTDASGLAVNQLQFNGPAPQGSSTQQFTQNTITASTFDASATFILTEALVNPQFSQAGNGLQAIITTAGPFLQTLFAGEALSGQSGTSGSTPIVVRIGSSSGFPISNVSLQLVSLQDPSVGPVVSCRESQGGDRMVLSDESGIATCTPQFSGTPGQGRFYVLIGGGGAAPLDPLFPPSFAISFRDTNLTVTPASPGSIRVIQGNSQTVNPSQTLPVPLQVEVDGFNGGPLAGQQVRWTANPPSMVSIVNPVTTTDAAGRTSTAVTVLGNAAGTIQVTATVLANTSLSSTFTITVVPVVTITGFTLVSGSNQSAPIGTAFAQPLVVQVTASSGSASGVSIQFATSGSVSLSSTTATTDANGRAQVSATAGSVTGPASVTASIATNSGIGSQTFNLTVLPQAPNITAGSFVNGADYQVQSLSPCSIGALVAPAGTLGISNASPTFPGQPLPPSNISLTISNVGAPILSVSTLPSGQQGISFQVPCEVTTGGAVPAAVNLGGGTTNVNLNIQAASPGIFQTVMSDGVLRAVVLRPDGSFVTLTNPARRNENVSIFVTGMGRTLPAVGTGSVPTLGTPAAAQGTVVLGMAGSGVSVVSARLTEDLPGVFLVTFSIPSDMQTGSNVAISVASIPPGSNTPIYSATTKIPVQ